MAVWLRRVASRVSLVDLRGDDLAGAERALGHAHQMQAGAVRRLPD